MAEIVLPNPPEAVPNEDVPRAQGFAVGSAGSLYFNSQLFLGADVVALFPAHGGNQFTNMDATVTAEGRAELQKLTGTLLAGIPADGKKAYFYYSCLYFAGLVPYKENCVVHLTISSADILSYVAENGFLQDRVVDISAYEYEGFDPVKYVNHYASIFRTKRESLLRLAAIVFARGHNFKRMVTRMPDTGKAVVMRTLADLGLSSTPAAGKLQPLTRTAQRFLSCIPVLSLKISQQHQCRMIPDLPPWLRSSVGYGLASTAVQKKTAINVALKKTIITNTKVADLPRALRMTILSTKAAYNSALMPSATADALRNAYITRYTAVENALLAQIESDVADVLAVYGIQIEI